MEENLVPEFIEKLPRRNTSSYVLLRIGLGYAFIFTIAFVLGIVFFSLFSAGVLKSEKTATIVFSHFSKVFDGCSSCKDYFTVIIAASASDIRLLFLLFTSGFTYFSGIATSAFTACRAFTFGFSFRYLMLISDELFNSQSVVFVFAVFELAFALLMLFLCVKSQVFSYDFRRIRERKSRMISSPVIYMYMLLYLTAFGLVLILNACSCVTSLILYS